MNSNNEIYNKPILTIAIPTYKRPKYLIQAIESALNQNEQAFPYEVIVVNNDPDSDMQDIKKMYVSDNRIRFFNNSQNIGMLGNVNRCVSLARGNYISFLHDDDLLLPNYISEIKQILIDGKISCLIPQRYLLFEKQHPDEKFEIEERRKKKEKLISFMFPRYFTRRRLTSIRVEDNVFAWQNCYCAPTCGVIFCKEALQETGLFFPEGTYSWDFISFLNLNKKESISILHTSVSVYRMTSGLSLKEEVQYDFYVAYRALMQEFPESTHAGRFIKKYMNEIHYLNYISLNPFGKEYVKKRIKDVIQEYPSRWKFHLFMLRRIIYFALHNLDVEKILTEEGKITLMNMGVLSE